ncbi:MAG: TatD family hydrolase [Lachnospiraceae bacterium]|nr:TatD family hydrolase [Lachnospiraceae bacterium]
MIFDTHAHYDDPAFDEDRDSLLPGLPKNGIGRVVNIGTNRITCEKTLSLTKQYPFMYGALGVHPSDLDDWQEEDYSWLYEKAGDRRIIAIGEIGLDYYWEKDEAKQAAQRQAFIRQLKLAKELSLPVVVHSREAAQDTMQIVKQYGQGLGGMIHCYSYHAQDAVQYVKMGYCIGIGGVITFKNAKKLWEVAEAIPPEAIVLETDCPYLAPEPFRGKRNCSLYLRYVVEALSRCLQKSPEEIEALTFQNALRIYRIDGDL